MTPHQQIPVRVREIEPLTPTLKRFHLEAADGGPLPTSSAGSHVVMTLQGADRGWKNAYSIVSPPGERQAYQIIVRRVLRSRGGSAHMHEAVSQGDVLQAAMPHNLVPICVTGRRHVLISGGIGITPMLSHLAGLRAQGNGQVEVHQFCNPAEISVFEALLAPYAGPHTRVHPPGSEAADIEAVLARQPLGTHVYVCGPEPLMNLVQATAERLGWPASAFHQESFGDHSSGAPFTAVLSRSHLEIEVGATQSLLEAVEAAGVDAPYLCRGGACGQCQTKVLAGEPDHRDHVLTDEERAAGESMMICVSRAKTPRLVLDL